MTGLWLPALILWGASAAGLYWVHRLMMFSDGASGGRKAMLAVLVATIGLIAGWAGYNAADLSWLLLTAEVR